MEKFPRETAPAGETDAESPEKKRQTAAELKTSLLEANADIIGDRVFQQIIESVEEGWDSLTETRKKSLIESLAELIDDLRRYHDSYVGLKFASSPERYASQDIEKYKEATMHADQREHFLHNAFIDAVNILSRKMKNWGLRNDWRADEQIDGLDQYATREKLKDWMFKIFKVNRPPKKRVGQ